MGTKLKKTLMMKTPKSANCPQFLDNLERLVDGCMSADEEKEFLSAIEPNIDCIEKLEIQKAFKQLLATKLEKKCCSQSLLYNIKECIKNE